MSVTQDCIFCKIVRGEIPCAKIFETETVMAFLDISPVRPGHALVIPKAHHANLWELPAELGADLLTAMQVVGKAVTETVGAGGVNVGMNNHAPAGQVVMHAHFHLIPRHEGDGLSLWPQGAYASLSEMTDLAQAISAKIL